jgi:hypothetical protein
MDDTEVGMSRSLEKAAIHSIVGAETIVPVLEGAMRDGGVKTVSLLVRSSPEALVAGKNGSDLEYSTVAFGLSGFCLDDADEATGMFGLCSVAKERPAQEMTEAGGGLPQAP